jgi:hypothetical protein
VIGVLAECRLEPRDHRPLATRRRRYPFSGSIACGRQGHGPPTNHAFYRWRRYESGLTGLADPLLEALLLKAIERNIVVVIMQPQDGDLDASLAAAIDAVIHVRITAADHRQSGGFSVTAPGEDVLTTFPGGRYDFISGSSFAAAHVSGVIALLRALQPSLPPSRIETVLQGSADDDTPAAVNACEALARLRGEGECRSNQPFAMANLGH